MVEFSSSVALECFHHLTMNKLWVFTESPFQERAPPELSFTSGAIEGFTVLRLWRV